MSLNNTLINIGVTGEAKVVSSLTEEQRKEAIEKAEAQRERLEQEQKFYSGLNDARTYGV